MQAIADLHRACPSERARFLVLDQIGVGEYLFDGAFIDGARASVTGYRSGLRPIPALVEVDFAVLSPALRSV